MIRCDGVYAAGQGEFRSYIRFYDDGTVLTCSTLATPDQLAKWFNREDPKNSRGVYEIHDDKIKFFSSSGAGTVEYSGVIDGNCLRLHVYSRINGYRDFVYFQFVAVTFPQPNQASGDASSTSNEDRVIETEEDRVQYYKEILELEGELTIPKIKEAYRTIIVKYHPDKVAHLGPEFKDLASRKTVRITEAYEYFRDKFAF